MKPFSDDEIKIILEKHKKWVHGEPGGEMAYLYMANLSGANLRGADLRGANLSGAYLYMADLSGAKLRMADLYGADLRRADLRRADLRWANFSEADLRCANLYMADIYGADLRWADLSGANDVTYPIACPEKGSFIAFKKAKCDLIVELEITEDALRCSATSRKCRCSKARVISITNLDGSPASDSEAISNYDSSFVYKVGEIVSVDNFDTNRWNECSTGIHFFITRQEAVDY